MNKTEHRMKPWSELTLADHFIFQKVMMNDELCKQVLSEIIGKEVVRIERFDYEKSIMMRYDAKGIQLDVYVKGEDEVYNVEIQNSDNCHIAKRSRFYQSMIDLELLEKGEEYERLGRSYVIFICTFDYFGRNQYQYTFTYQCEEVEGLEFGDMTTHIILNTKGSEGNISEKLKTFLKCIENVFSDDSFSARIKKEVEQIKFSEMWRAEYMYYELTLKEHEKIGEERGIEIGEQRGIEIGENIIKLLKSGNSVKEVAKELNVSVDDVQKVKDLLAD
ncbi:MAG: Rpn family recombination-promoting nuclease/putative transposase [Eubacterium sp.]|nr:Rpn family recombination-promoting nuclease/putative transposase [Eubacterium sp.]